MIPSTALELVVFLAALGPGYLYIRVAEQRANRPERSGLVEAVELVVIGAFASTVALLGVLALAGWANVLHVHALGRDPSAYLKLHPLRLFWVVAIALLFAYGLAYAAARLVHRHQSPTIRPAALRGYLRSQKTDRPTTW